MRVLLHMITLPSTIITILLNRWLVYSLAVADQEVRLPVFSASEEFQTGRTYNQRYWRIVDEEN